MARKRRRWDVECFNETQNYWFRYFMGPYDTRAEARKVAARLWQYKTRIVPVSEVVDG